MTDRRVSPSAGPTTSDASIRKKLAVSEVTYCRWRGRPELFVLGLDELDPTGVGSPADQNRWAELISHHRVGEGGALAHLADVGWLRLWHDLRRGAHRSPGAQ